MKNKEQILNGYQATFALSKTSKSQIYMAMDEYAKIKLKEAFHNHISKIKSPLSSINLN